jgi:tape measure domain-containing protein
MKPVEIEFLMKDRLSGGIDNARMKADLLDASLKRMAATIGGVFTVQKAIQFGKVMLEVRGEIEMMEKSFEALLQGKNKSDAMMSAIMDYSAKSTYSITDLSKGAQLLIGFGLEAERVMPVMQQLGNIAMGNQDRFNALALAFAQMNAAGKLMGQDLLQMINAGFNPLMYISEKTGKSIGELRKEMEEGAISSQMVAEAFADATAEGGKFHGMLEKQMEGVVGAQAQLKNAWINALNEIGQSQQSLITGGYKLTKTLVQNYETVGKALAGLIATYGAYKAAVMLNIVAERGWTVSQLAQYRALLMVEKAQKLLNATMLANPYVLLATAVVGLAAALWTMHDRTSEAEKAQKRLNDKLAEAKKKKDELIGDTDAMIAALKGETSSIQEQAEAWRQLKEAIPEVFQGKDISEITAMTDDDIKKLRDKYVDKKNREDLVRIKDELRKELDEIERKKEKLTADMNRGPKNSRLFAKMQISGELENLKALHSVISGQYEESQKRIEEYDAVAAAKKEAVRKKETTKNKEYWETQKKIAESALAAMDVSKKGTPEWLKLEKDIEKADGELQKYSPVKNSSKPDSRKSESAAEKDNVLKADQKAREQQIREYAASLIAQQKQSEFDIRQARTDGMKAGTDRELAQIRLNYDKLLEENRLREEKWVKDLQAKSNLEFENANPEWKKKGLEAPTVSEEDLTDEQQKQLRDYTDSAVLYRDKAEEKLYKDLLDKYKSYSEQYFEITKKYEDEIDAMKKKGASEESVALAEQAKADAMTALDEEFAQKEETFKDLMMRIGRMSLQQLEKTLREAENALKKSDIDNGENSKQSATQRAKIKKLQEEIKAVKTENEMKESDEAERWKRTEKAIRDCKSEIDNMLDSMDFLDEATKSALQSASNVAEGAIAMINGIKMLGIGAAASISAVEKASVILAIIGAAVQIITAIFNMASAAEARHQGALKEIAAERTAFQREYNLLLIEQNELLEKAETIFGVDAYGKALGSIHQMREAVTGLNKEIFGEKPELDPLGFGVLFSDHKKKLDAYERGVGGLYDIRVKTDHEKTGLFGWGKGRDVYSSVLEVYPDLIDKTGKFDAEIAQLILDTRTLSDEDKATLEQMIALSKKAEEAFESVKNYLTDIFGELGNTMSDALVDAFRNGTDAAEKFAESVTGMLEDLAEQMIYTVTIAPYLQKAQEDMLATMQDENLTNEQKFNKYVSILDSMTDDVMRQQGVHAALLEEYQRVAKEKGINLWESDAAKAAKQSGKAGAYQAASQDSITRLEGLYSSMLEHEISIDGRVENIAEGMNAALGHLRKIEENTGSSDGHLEKIEKAMETMKDDIAVIKRDGVRTR